MSSSMEAKSNINVVNNFYKSFQKGRKPAKADANRSGFEGLESSQGVRIGLRH
jgi:hypothetical protein